MIPKSQKTNENVAGVEGLEPPTHGLEIRCSIHLSYTPVARFRQPAAAPYRLMMEREPFPSQGRGAASPLQTQLTLASWASESKSYRSAPNPSTTSG